MKSELRYFKYYTSEGYKSTSDEQEAINKSNELKRAYIEGFLGKCGGVGVWSWTKRSEHSLETKGLERDWNGRLGWNSFI